MLVPSLAADAVKFDESAKLFTLHLSRKTNRPSEDQEQTVSTNPAGDPQNPQSNSTWLKENLGPLVGLALLGAVAYAGLHGWGANPPPAPVSLSLIHI